MNLRRFYVISQIEYCHNFNFRRNFPIRKLFQRSCELGLATLTANKVSNMFGTRITKGFKGKLQVVVERLDQAHHNLRAYFKNSFVKQYEKFRTFFRMEIRTNNTPDIRVRRSLVNLPLVRQSNLIVPFGHPCISRHPAISPALCDYTRMPIIPAR